MNKLQLRRDFFASLPTQPNLSAAARRADMTFNTAKRWTEAADELEVIDLDTFYAILSGMAGMSDAEILSLRLDEFLTIVGR